MNLGSVLMTGVLLLIAAALYFYERRMVHVRELALIVSVAAVAGISRVPFAGLPSVQPTTFIVLYSGFVLGPFIGAAIGMTAAWISNLFLLQGPWTPWQMLAWGLVGVTGGLVSLRAQRYSRTTLLVLGFLWGFLFGWIMNFWYWAAFAYPLNWKTFVSVNGASLLFDAAHAAGNVVFILIFGEPLFKILTRCKDKLVFVHFRS